jgi:hypothetical protein
MRKWMILCAAAYGLASASGAHAVDWRAAFAVPAIAGDPREQRVDLYDVNSNRQGYVVISAHGRVDIYDRLSNRTGTGRISPDGKTIELFDLHGNWTGTGRLAR